MEKRLWDSRYWGLVFDTDEILFGIDISIFHNDNPGILLDIGLGPIHFLGSLPNEWVWSKYSELFAKRDIKYSLNNPSKSVKEPRISYDYDKLSDYKHSLVCIKKLFKDRELKFLSKHKRKGTDGSYITEYYTHDKYLITLLYQKSKRYIQFDIEDNEVSTDA